MAGYRWLLMEYQSTPEAPARIAQAPVVMITKIDPLIPVTISIVGGLLTIARCLNG